MVLNSWCTVVWGTTSVLTQPWIAVKLTNFPFCVQDSSLRYCVERSWDWQNYVHSSLGLVTDNFDFYKKEAFLSFKKWRRNFCRFKLHATCACTSLMAAILWNTNSTRKDTRQCSYEWEMIHQKQRTTIKYYHRARLRHSTRAFVVAVFSQAVNLREEWERGKAKQAKKSTLFCIQ